MLQQKLPASNKLLINLNRLATWQVRIDRWHKECPASPASAGLASRVPSRGTKATVSEWARRKKQLDQIIYLLQMGAVLIAALIIGNWFMSEVKKVRLRKEPWYRAYLSLPGIVIIGAVSLPIIIWVLKK